jgi:hypothetical protein
MNRLPPVAVGMGASIFNPFAAINRINKAVASAITPRGGANRAMPACPPGYFRAQSGQCVKGGGPTPGGQTSAAGNATHTTNLPARYVSGPPVGVGAPAAMPDPVGSFMKALMEKLKPHPFASGIRAKNAHPQFTTMVKR